MILLSESRKKDLKNAGSELALDTFLNVGSEAGANIAKESIASAAGDFAVDAVSSFIPGLSGAIQNFKRNRFERNMNKVTEELHSKLDEIHSNLEFKTLEQREQIDELFQYMLDAAMDEQQEEKIEYMVNGFVNITEHDFISEDFVLTYYDILKELRIIDISVLRLMYSSRYFFYQESRETFQDVMERHGITYEQYEAVRRNLLRIGLLTTKTDLNVADDIKEISKTFKDLFLYLEKLTASKPGRLPKLKDPKLKSKEQLELSRFGRDFVKFFLDLEQPLTE